LIVDREIRKRLLAAASAARASAVSWLGIAPISMIRSSSKIATMGCGVASGIVEYGTEPKVVVVVFARSTSSSCWQQATGISTASYPFWASPRWADGWL